MQASLRGAKAVAGSAYGLAMGGLADVNQQKREHTLRFMYLEVSGFKMGGEGLTALGPVFKSRARPMSGAHSASIHDGGDEHRYMCRLTIGTVPSRRVH